MWEPSSASRVGPAYFIVIIICPLYHHYGHHHHHGHWSSLSWPSSSSSAPALYVGPSFCTEPLFWQSSQGTTHLHKSTSPLEPIPAPIYQSSGPTSILMPRKSSFGWNSCDEFWARLDPWDVRGASQQRHAPQTRALTPEFSQGKFFELGLHCPAWPPALCLPCILCIHLGLMMIRAKRQKSPTLSAGIFELGSGNEENAERLNWAGETFRNQEFKLFSNCYKWTRRMLQISPQKACMGEGILEGVLRC